jgi:hypothetical protein
MKIYLFYFFHLWIMFLVNARSLGGKNLWEDALTTERPSQAVEGIPELKRREN